MALIDILEKINKETQKSIDQLKKDFEEKKKKLEEEYKTLQKQIDDRMHRKVEENSKKIMEKAENLAERERQNQILEAKRKMINETMDLAIKKLCESDKYEETITEMLKKSDLDEENTVVVPARGKEDITKNAIKNSGKGYYLSDKSADIKGGFILKTDKVEIDNSFETIINEQLRDALEIKLNKSLFA
ncbi:hypothetical protein GF366_04910 [Candidatus Peregrinibacteria bacterium]|nr:hypothetical protein [Candidatus Peregrinibacteria bacterium]